VSTDEEWTVNILEDGLQDFILFYNTMFFIILYNIYSKGYVETNML
jgi:hypothetical protein